MLRISALNDSDGSDDSQASDFVKEATKEAKEAETYSLYNKALGLLRHGQTDKAEDVFRDLIDHDFLQEAIDILDERGNDAIHPGLQLLYSIYKNLAAMATQRKDYSSALDSYLEAVKIDNSEVTVWYKIGITALKVEDFQLAKGAFEEGLECNPKHWPCLDNIITVMYALNNYAECLYFISKAFEMEIYYDKGHAIRNKIYQEQPCLQSDFEEFFQYCDKELMSVKVDSTEAKKYVDEALQMRKRRQELSVPPEPVRLKFPEKLKEYSWQFVGEKLIELYDKAVTSDPIISLCLRVDVPSYDGVASENELSKTDEKDSKVPNTVAACEATETSDKSEEKECEVAMETEDKEVPKAMEVDEVTDKTETETEEKGNIDDKQTAEPENDVKEDSSKDVTEKPEEDGEKKQEATQNSNIEKMDVSEDATEGQDKVEKGSVKPEVVVVPGQDKPETGSVKQDIIVVPDESNDSGNDSVLEAASLAHSLLDSLSPAKTPFSPKDTHVDSSPTIQGKGEKEGVDKQFGMDKTVGTEHITDPATDNVQVDTPPGSLVKTSSIGFSVSGIVVDSVDCVPDTSDVNVKSVLPEQTNKIAELETESESPNTVDITSKLSTSQLETVPPHQENPHVPVTPPVIDLTEDNTESETEGNKVESSPATSKAMTSPSENMTSLSVNVPLSVDQSILTSSPLASTKVTNPGTDLLSPIPSVNPTLTSSTNTAVSSVTMTTKAGDCQAPPILVQEFQNKDHAYSKPSLSYDSVPMVTSPQGQGQMLTVGSIPVTQPLLKNVDSNMLDSSPGIGLDMEDRNLASKKVQKKRKISLATEEIMMYGKRRSARVRNTGKKKEEGPVNFKDLLHAFLPSSLKTVQEEDSSTMDSSKDDSVTADKSNTGENSEGKTAVTPTFTVWDETNDVKSFLKEQSVKNSGLVDIMNKFLHAIARNWKLKWSETLYPVYIDVFNRIRRHMYIPNVLDVFDEADIFQEVALICLSLAELQLDQWSFERSKVTGSQCLSPKGKTTQVLLEECIPAFFEDDFMFLTILCGQSDRMSDHWIDHCVRVYWMKSKYAILLGKFEEAIHCYERLKEYLEYMTAEYGTQQVVIPNCKMENLVTLDLVTSQQDMLQKSHCVEETQRLYDMAEYERVVEILLQTFPQHQHKAKVVKVDSAERQFQLTLLQDAMFKTGDNKRSVLWGEESLNEAYLEYKSTDSTEEKSAWLKTLIDILPFLQLALERDIMAVRSLPSTKLVRLTRNLIRLIDKNMSLPESATEMTVDTVIPWALLFQLIKHEEDKIESMRLKDSNNSDDLEDTISSSQMLLNVAHDYLGGRSWCTKSDGFLLLFFMKILKEKMEVESDNMEEYEQAFEQCVFCLFNHPNKKAKAKHLQDHNVTGIPLLWEHAILVFDYFKPKTIPEFDGYKSETISTELEVLFKRIIPLVPDKCKSKVLPQEEVLSYIEGTKVSPPALKEGSVIDNVVLEEIYYLLGDYYLKNKEAGKAIKFYMHDLCVRPDRLDSWAGMSLARMSQLESKLTSAELKMDAPIYKKSIAALRCFKRATEIDDSNAKLWIEYGTLAYQLHAHASKQIRWKKWFAMEQELVDIAVESKREMLQTAMDCFKQASNWNEEEWLHNYMLGKCIEKMRKPVKDVLPYYFQALQNVHEEKAKYPKKIIYAYTTSHLSVEALEMYYRIHSVIFKCLMKHTPESEEIDYKLFVTSIVEVAFTPFVLRVEKGQEAKLDRESASSADESSCSETKTPNKKSTHGSTDHTYFRQKSNQDGGSVVSTDADTSNKPEIDADDKKDENTVKPGVVVTTMELHAEQSSDEKVTLTTTTTECTTKPSDDKTDTEKTPGNTEKPGSGEKHSSLSEKVLGTSENVHESKETVEETVRNVLNHIEDLVIEKLEKSGALNPTPKATDLDKDLDEAKLEKMDVDETSVNAESDVVSKGPDGRDGSVDEEMFNGLKPKGPKSTNLLLKKQEMLDSLLKLSKEDLHKELLDRCRKAFEMCLHRFPTHYKSHYRLAQMYSQCHFVKDLKKAHNILLAGQVKWTEMDYMASPALFGERKMSKFFQGIWKIPIDEIDRAGSFPSHLNRCIDLTLNILKEERDCSTLHQIHLQLNRQPEPGKKYLRDAEKKYYALMSHRYTLDAAEARIQDMKSVTDAEQRHKFLLLFYKIWEHGVHKLNKHVERTNKLLAEAYRVVVRKLETLPIHMLSDQAIRYCKHLISQKSKSDKDPGQQSSEATSESKSKSGLKLSTAKSAIKAIRQISLETMKTTGNLSVLKNSQEKKGTKEGQNDTNSKTALQEKTVVADEGPVKTGESIVIDSSSDSEKGTDKETVTPDVKLGSGVKTGAVPAVSETKAPTVKIKMGLLQAAKRLKPNPATEEGKKMENDEDKMETDLDNDVPLDDEIEPPIPELEEGENDQKKDLSSSSSSSSSSSGDSDSSDSSSDDDEDDDDDQKNDADIDDDKSDDSSDEDVKQANVDDGDEKQPEATFEPPDIQVVISSSEDDEEEESSDNSQEVDLVSSEDDTAREDDKDTDYKASEDDEDVIMISDDEFKAKGRAVVPSPPHEVKTGQEQMEVLVEKEPDFNPIISSFMG